MLKCFYAFNYGRFKQTVFSMNFSTDSILKSIRILTLLISSMVIINACSDDNAPGTSNNNNNGGGNTTGGCAGGPSTVTDIDGNVYNVVSIGNQCWMKENLKTTHYKNGLPILAGVSDSLWETTTIGACADYNNDTSNSSVYGRLYNWFAVADPSGLCPTGWHVPEDWEWNILVKAIDSTADTSCVSCIQSGTAGGNMKEVGLSHWIAPNNSATNSSGFSGLPGGFRNVYGTYGVLGKQGVWWSATLGPTSTAYYRQLQYYYGNLYTNFYNRSNGFSVRCVKD
jgi:uncharacterized protein (TIGR02145 family)